MALFGKPRQVKKLDQEIAAARIALSMFDRLAPDHQQHLLATAPREIREAAATAAAAGESGLARKVLTDARARAPDSTVADRWPGIIDEALAAL